ncbi:MAG: GntR family transcriptional regulator [Puniceicoccaceae bacterium]|nr:MAG: GntR family transcriptional regulator [Puniceicoccaceae bacterium]
MKRYERGTSRRAREALRNWLHDQAYPPGTRLPSARQLAEALGHTQYATNRAVNELVERGLLRRQGYHLYTAAQHPEIHAPIHIASLWRADFSQAGLVALAEDTRVQLSSHHYNDRAGARKFLLGFHEQRVDGILFWPPNPPGPLLNEISLLGKAGIPTVAVNTILPGVHSLNWNFWDAFNTAALHLVAGGYRELAGYWRGVEADWRPQWKGICHSLGLASSASRHASYPGRPAANAAALLERLRSDWKNVNGMVIFDPPTAENLLPMLQKAGYHVPNDMALITIGDTAETRTASPPISSMASLQSGLNDAAWHLLLSLIRSYRKTGFWPADQILWGQLKLHVRGSTVQPATEPAIETNRAGNRIVYPWSRNPSVRREEASAMNSRPHPSARGEGAGNFLRLDLSGVVNRPVQFRRGWLGDQPLLNLPPGERAFHGVPFHILGGKNHQDNGVLVLRSRHNQTSQLEPLPSRVAIPVGAKTRAVYFLHGCGYASSTEAFAAYTIHTSKGRKHQIPLVPLSWRHPDNAPEANIQDWWSDFPQHDLPHALKAVITEDGDPFLYERYLYTLEWVHPDPTDPVRQIVISSPGSSEAALAVLAISVLKA